MSRDRSTREPIRTTQGLALSFPSDRPNIVVFSSAVTAFPHELERRMSLMSLLRDAVKADCVEVTIPNAKRINKDSYEVDRARGFNIEGAGDQVVGTTTEFLKVDTQTKTNAMLNYLRVVNSLNNRGYTFVDHKPDSVFIDPETGVVTIVDCDAIRQESEPWKVDRLEKGGLKDVLISFFTRGSEKTPHRDEHDFSTFVPGGIHLILDDLSRYNSASDLVTRLEQYLQGSYTPEYTQGLGDDTMEDILIYGIEIAREYGVDVSDIEVGRSAAQTDINIADLQRRITYHQYWE